MKGLYDKIVEDVDLIETLLFQGRSESNEEKVQKLKDKIDEMIFTLYGLNEQDKHIVKTSL